MPQIHCETNPMYTIALYISKGVYKFILYHQYSNYRTHEMPQLHCEINTMYTIVQ